MSSAWLLNENFPVPAATCLRQAGWDLLHVSGLSSGINDVAVLTLASAQGRALATFDRDYGELVFRRRLPTPTAILYFRVAHYRPTDPADWMISLETAGLLQMGYFHRFDGETIRSRRLP